MVFSIEGGLENILNLMRRLGYSPAGPADFTRRLGRYKFPRFHIYVNKKENKLSLSLHLDQKGVSYQGQTAHSGDYSGQALAAEKERITNLLK